MKFWHMLKYITSLLLFCSISIFGQVTDTIAKQHKTHAIRFGIDISKPIIAIFNSKNSGLELVADYQISKNIFAAVEFGFSDFTGNEDYLNYTSKGSYAKIGVNYNVYKNWLDMKNEIYFGIRYGYATFSNTLNSYTINQYGTYFNNQTVTPGTKFSNLNAGWLTLTTGIKVEVFNNLYLGTSVSLNKRINSKEPSNFKNLYIPGFHRVFSNNAGIGFNYTISYSIPLLKN